VCRCAGVLVDQTFRLDSRSTYAWRRRSTAGQRHSLWYLQSVRLYRHRNHPENQNWNTTKSASKLESHNPDRPIPYSFRSRFNLECVQVQTNQSNKLKHSLPMTQSADLEQFGTGAELQFSTSTFVNAVHPNCS
jgi:hypothetical protein